MKKIVFILLNLHSMVFAQPATFLPAKVSFDDFKKLVLEVEPYRQERLISLDTFLLMSKEKNVVILDTRSDFRFKRKHIKGAIHLAFTDFTQDNLHKLIPDSSTRILIYCNNNFDDDEIDFASKMAIPQKAPAQFQAQAKPIMLALNIPTYINLYSYGYRNIYELAELVNVKDSRIHFEGSVVE
jgi:hypothetical protein